MKKLRLRKWVKYLILGIFNSILLYNLPELLRQTDTINNYRYNLILITFVLIANGVAVAKIEKI